MVNYCSAFGCKYRCAKGDGVGLYTFPKDEALCKRWVLAVKRANWWPSPSSRICGRHFLTGRPSKSESHPDYVPSVFVYNSQHQNKAQQGWQYANAKKRVREMLVRQQMKNLPGFRPIRPKTEKPYVIRASTEIVTKYKTMQMISVMKENDSGNKKTVEDPNVNSFLICKEITPPLPQGVWVQNFPLEKKDSNVSIEKLKGKMKSILDKSTASCEDKNPLYVESSFIVSDDDSTLTAESSIPASEDTVSCMSSDKDTSFHDADGTENNALDKVSSPSVCSVAENATDPDYSEFKSRPSDAKDIPAIKLEIPDKNTSFHDVGVTENDTLGNVSSSVVCSVAENATDPDYSEFKPRPSDTKDILAIKLETMLAVNISLQQKVKIYQSRCKNYEKEISELTSTIKKLNLQNSS